MLGRSTFPDLTSLVVRLHARLRRCRREIEALHDENLLLRDATVRLMRQAAMRARFAFITRGDLDAEWDG